MNTPCDILEFYGSTFIPNYKNIPVKDLKFVLQEFCKQRQIFTQKQLEKFYWTIQDGKIS